jgi:hypothetical protein
MGIGKRKKEYIRREKKIREKEESGVIEDTQIYI